MHNNDSRIFTQGIPHFLTIELFFEEVLLNLNKAEKHSRDRITTTRVMPAFRQCMEGETIWPRSLKTTTKKISKLERTEGKKIAPKKEEKKEQ